MDEFNVMPQPSGAPGPVHKPTNSSPLPPTPTVPGMTPPSSGGVRRFRWKYLLIIPIVLIIAILVFGYLVVAKGQTKYGEQLQNELWKAVVDNTNEENKDLDITITYEDKGKYRFIPSTFLKKFDGGASSFYGAETDSYYKEMDSRYSFDIVDPLAKARTISYFNISDKDNPQLDLRVEGTINNNNKSFEGSYDVKLLPKEMYARYNYNSNIEDLIKYLEISSGPDPDKNIWYQTTDEYSLKYLKESVRGFTGQDDSEDSKELEEYKQLLRDNRLFDIDSLKGISIIEGDPTLHYSLRLNKDKVKNLVNAALDKALEGNSDAEAREFIKEVTDVLLEKINVSNYEVWVGVKNRKVYKSTMTIDAVSITKAADYFEKALDDPNNPLSKALGQDSTSQSKSRDAKRLADMRQMASALELYFNDNNSYPPSQNGQPVGITPNYIGQIPTAPTPADGNCDEYFNTYWYTQLSPTSYTYTFCLGGNTGGIAAGTVTMSEMGIAPSNMSNEPPSNDIQQGEVDVFESFKSAVINTLRNLTFDAKITVEYVAKNFGQSRNVEAPSDYKKQEDRYPDYYDDSYSY